MSAIFAVTWWQAPTWEPRIKVIKMHESDELSGIGWESISEHATYAQAMAAARVARALIAAGHDPAVTLACASNNPI